MYFSPIFVHVPLFVLYCCDLLLGFCLAMIYCPLFMANNNSTLHLALGLNDDIVETLEPELNPLEFHHAYSLSRDTTLAYNYLYEIWLGL